uniref:Uncharacterized protein n=1 Tax=Panagrolaimus sp. JU765 TaxID=591449 RepID=A0AC34QNK9_9BILA
MDKTIDSGISLSSMDLQSSSSSVATSKSKASIRSVKSEPIISIKTEVVDLSEDLWILPCSSKNLAKRYLFIVSKENPNLGSKLMFRGTFESNLIYCCPKCADRETEVSASVFLSNGRISVKFEETLAHKQKCYQIDLKKTLSNETRILINPKNE